MAIPLITPLDRTSPTFRSDVDAVFSGGMNASIAGMNAAAAALDVIAAGGAYTFSYVFDAGTANVDPTAGKLGLNNANQQLATSIRVSTTSNGVNVASILDVFDDSTNAIKGSIRLTKRLDPGKWLTFDLTAVATPTGYRNITAVCTGYSSANPFSSGDDLLLTFTRAGDKGDSGALTLVLWVRDEKTTGTHGGAATAGATVQRMLNTVKKNSISGASLAGNQITLPAGTYRISLAVPCYSVGYTQAWLYNVTDSVNLIVGSSEYNVKSTVMNAEVTLSTAKVLEVRHYTYATSSPSGLGMASSSGQAEVYTEVFIEKVS